MRLKVMMLINLMKNFLIQNLIGFLVIVHKKPIYQVIADTLLTGSQKHQLNQYQYQQAKKKAKAVVDKSCQNH